MKNSWSIDFITLFITYGAVKLVHWLVGFDYDIFSEGIFSIKFLIDIASWGGIYAVVYFVLNAFFPNSHNPV